MIDTGNNIDSSSWTITAVELPSLTSIDRVLVEFQQSFQIGNEIYSVHPELGSSTYDYQTLLKYDLQSREFVDIATYNYMSLTHQQRACVCYNTRLNEFYVAGGSDVASK